MSWRSSCRLLDRSWCWPGLPLRNSVCSTQKSLRYLILNVVGSTVLAVDAVIERQWGFLLLEGVWAIVSAVSMITVLRGRNPAASH